MADDLERMRVLALDLARAAGRYAVERLETKNGAVAKGAGADVVTDVDHEAERRIVAGIAGAFPDHAVLGEESGTHGPDNAPVRWLVDPLDGTNNYVMGMPLFGVCLTACIDDEPVVAVMHDSVRNLSTSAVRGGGTIRGDRQVRVGPATPPARTTVSWSQGYGVRPEDSFRVRAMEALEGSFKRVLRTWSPSIDWGLLASGQTGAIVLYRNEIWDQVGGLLLVQEAGGVVHHATEAQCVIAGRPDCVRTVRQLLDL